MKRRFVVFCWIVLAALPVLAQEKLYPVRSNRNVPLILTPDRYGIVVEKAFQHKLTLGFPSGDRAEFLPDTRSRFLIFSLRIHNVSPRPLAVDIAKFTCADDMGHVYTALAPEEAANRMLADSSAESLGTKTLRSISLGRAANRPTEEQVREDMDRYSIRSGDIPAGSVREGLIYFEKPPQKKFTVMVTLGDLWSQPLVFSTSKQK
jgi:hypothetical protein